MARFMSSVFSPKNPDKCLNSRNGKPIQCRSSWERHFCNWLDQHQGVIEWGSEVMKIPYFHPLKNRPAFYFPDFLIHARAKTGQEQIRLIEIKPLKERLEEHAKSKYDKAALIVNRAKWTAAIKVCEANGIIFQVLSENELFRTPKK